MSKRNAILLIIILVIVIISVFGFLYFRQRAITPGVDEGTNFFSQFNPFGSGTTKPPTTTTPPTDVSGYIPPEDTAKLQLRKVSSMPIAGFTVYQKERLKEVQITSEVTNKPTPPQTEFMPSLRYVDRASGNIYQTFADKIEERKFSGTVIPKVYEAFFGNKGESVVMRYLKADGKTIETFVGNLPKEYLGADTSGENEVKGVLLPENTKDVSLSPSVESMFYLFNIGENIAGTTLNFLTNKKVQVFDSAFTEWLSQWPKSSMITLTTKPSSLVPGYMYSIDPGSISKTLNKILGGINGLTTQTSPSGKLVLYGNNTLSLSLYHIDTKTLETLGVKTLPEKCVWGGVSDVIYCAVPKITAGANFPDTWYQGEISFEDQIWKIDIITGNTTLIADPSILEGGEDVDAIKLAMDEGENYLFFVNKKDSFLWELELK